MRSVFSNSAPDLGCAAGNSPLTQSVRIAPRTMRRSLFMAYPRELVSLSIKVSDSPLHYSFLHFFSCVNLGVLPSSRRPGSRTFLQRGSPTPTSLASVARMPHLWDD